MVVVAIVGTLAALSYASFRNVPRAARVSSGTMALAGEISSAKAQAYGRDMRMLIVLYYPLPSGPLQYWTVKDPTYTVDDNMKANPSWKAIEDIVKPPSGQKYVLDHNVLDNAVTFVSGGYKAVSKNIVDTKCTTAGVTFALATGDGGGGGYFPPPYCMIPDDKGCTFCTTGADAIRGAIAFDPEGRIRLLDGAGKETTAGAGSITLSATGLDDTRGVSIALTPSGLIHTFRGPK